MEELTKAEERIMQLFWGLKKAFVKDVIDKMTDEPKTTIQYNFFSCQDISQ